MSDEFDRSTLPEGATLMDDLPRRQRKKNTEPVLTVGKLRQLLEGFEDDTVISSEGCDCVGDAGGITLFDGKLLITRWEEYVYE